MPSSASPAPRPCPTPVTLIRTIDGSSESRTLPLLDCEGRPDPESLAALNILARPRPGTTEITRLHPGLLERLRVIADRFPGHTIEIVSGYRPDASSGSRHHHGLALDVRVIGVSLDEVHRVVSRFDRTGVGLYRSGNLIHIDVRERSFHWTGEEDSDASLRVVRHETRPESSREPTEEIELDADAIADEVMRSLRTVPLPVTPSR